ncbi:PDZ domain-containing protein [Cocleimonas sp. KMM 6892]|uniref:PDZ domain-containing protein n=1 Tax=unclassified Cocleimonas TaxID=2639732 RepID=UPI002DBA5C25|nr:MULTISPECIES: PDZ domain-containing protein [unclassified Cocleimonas]MEB8433811.1 PDZ domain-containing protein [Cocleimonas sp. KMM 6892]MEC4716622.1 PDZ domain-containing protein [Cocleimonas sp. KMM 6895]MEC4746223.1 PDZ domain-containing protein [Cocleimonas sp. KMM 6896]
MKRVLNSALNFRIRKIIPPIFSVAAIALLTGTSQAQSPVFPPEQVFPQNPIPAYPVSPNNAYSNSYGQLNQPSLPGNYSSSFPNNFTNNFTNNFQGNQQAATQPYQINQNQLIQAQPQTQTQSQLQKPPQKPEREYSGFLGIILDILPEAVIAQLPDGVTQGVLIKGFSDNAPAASSELKPYDVMFAYDDIKLNHPAQFIKIVREDKPEREVKIKVVRKGEILEIPVVIGSQKTPDPREFNSLEIRQIGNNKFRAIVRFVGPNGNKQIRSYEGSRSQIFEQAHYAQDLPQAERQQLLNATRPIYNNSNNGFGNFFPFGGNNNGYNNGYNNGGNFMNPRRYFNW